MTGQEQTSRYKVAAIQFDPTIYRKEENLQRLLGMTEEAAAGGAQLIVLPEMAATGYSWYSREEVEPFAEEIPGPTTRSFESLANHHGCYIAVGLPEVDPRTNSFYNAAAFIGPGGLLGKYRKTHLFVADARWAREGDLGFPVFETELGRVGVLICQDLMYFEPPRVLALQGVDVICCPSNWLRSTQPSPFWAARAFENDVYIVCANRWGTEREVGFYGNSCVIDPDGRLREVSAGGDSIVCAEIGTAATGPDPAAPEGAWNKLCDRVPEQYPALALNPYLHDPGRLFGFNKNQRLPRGKRSLVAAAALRNAPAEGAGLESRLGHLLAGAIDAAPHPLELIVLPELDAEGTALGGAGHGDADTAGTRPGEIVVELARKFGLYVAWGESEIGGSRVDKKTVLAGPDGVVGEWHVLHRSPAERRGGPVGHGFPTFDTPVGRVGLLVGYDLLFPESARCLALAGADLICVPSPPWRAVAGIERTIDDAQVGLGGSRGLWQVRAGENNCYLAIGGLAHQERADVPEISWGIFGPNVWRRLKNGRVELKGGDLISFAFVDTGRDEYHRPSVTRSKELLAPRQTKWYDPLFDRRLSPCYE